jgi:hypothetical protein
VMALGHAGADAPEGGQARLELHPLGWRKLGKFTGEELAHEGHIAAPRHDVIEKKIAVCDENLSIGEIEGVLGRNIRIMVAGEESGGRRVMREEVEEPGALRSRVGLGCGQCHRRQVHGAGPGVEAITVQHEGVGSVEKWCELSQRAQAATAVTQVQVGKNAENADFRGHDKRKKRGSQKRKP